MHQTNTNDRVVAEGFLTHEYFVKVSILETHGRYATTVLFQLVRGPPPDKI